MTQHDTTLPNTSPSSSQNTSGDTRLLMPALKRGLLCRCPNCGKGALLHSYLKVNDDCSNCGEVFSHHRADDGPAYLTILIVGHLMIPLLGWAFVAYRPSPMTLIAIFGVSSVVLSLVLLPIFKGGVIAFQWAKHMYGFGAR